MNSFLLSLGIAIALAFVAAFAAPYFIDWSEHRAFLETRASEIVGRPVAFDGPLEVRIVPIPRVTAHDVRIGESTDTEAGEGAARMVIRAALSPLLRGELNVSEIVLERPRLDFVLGADGGVRWSRADREGRLPFAPENTRLEHFEIVDGRLSLEDAAGRRHVARNLNVTGSADALTGPFRFEGGAFLNDSRYTFQVNAGRLQHDGRLRLAASLVPADRPLTADFDGTLQTAGEDGPEFRGDMTVARPDLEDDALPWRIAGDIRADTQTLEMEGLSVGVGSETRQISLNGAAVVDLGSAPRFAADLSARQLDFDRTFGGGPDEPATPRTALDELGQLLEAVEPPMPGEIALDVGSIVLGGNLIQEAAAELALDDGVWRIAGAEASGPGQSTGRFSGTVEFGRPSPAVDGTLRVASEQAGVLASWLFGSDGRFPGLGRMTGRLDASTALTVEEGRLQLTHLDIASGETELGGEISYFGGDAERRPSLVARLKTNRLSLEGLHRSRLPELLALVEGRDVDLALEAEVAQAGPVRMRDVTAVAAFSEGNVRIDRLRVGDLEGATIDGHGEISRLAEEPAGRLELDLAADSLTGVSGTLAALGWDAAAEALDRRVDQLVPAELTLALRAGREGDAAEGVAVARGNAGGTELEARLEFAGQVDAFRDGDVTLSVEAANPEGSRIARQLGLAMHEGTGEGRFTLTARGQPNEAVAFSIDSSGLGLDGTADGEVRLDAEDGPEISAGLEFDIARPAGLLETAGLRLSEAALPASVTLSGQVSASDGLWRFPELALESQGATVNGDLSIDTVGPSPFLEGTLETSRLDLPWVLETLLGPETVRMAGSGGETRWSTAGFQPVDMQGWQAGLSLTAPSLELGNGYSLSQASLRLDVAPEGITMSNLEGGLFGGRLAADLDLAILAGAVQLEGQMELSEARLEEFVWRSRGRPVASGAAWLGGEVSGSGRSLSALISSLTGSGSLRVEDGVIRRMNPQAFGQIVRAADAGLELEEDEVRQVFAGHLDSGALSFATAEGAMQLAGGVLRARNITLDNTALESFASATLDLATLSLESEWTLRLEDDERDGRVREAGIVFAGPVEAPRRQIDVGPLLGYLTVRDFEQEVERLEQLQSEIDARRWLGQEMVRFGRAQERFDAARERRQAEEAEAESDADSQAEDAAAAEARAGEAGDDPGVAPDVEPGPGDAAEDAGARADSDAEEEEDEREGLESMIRRALESNEPAERGGGEPLNIVPQPPAE